MKYTKEQLQAMSDRQIDCVLGDILHDVEIVANLFNEGNHFIVRTKYGVDFWVPEYCNNPNDIMPLAFEHSISLISLSDGYMASKCETIYMEDSYRSIKFCDPSDTEFAHNNPLRAITCCLILVLQEKQDE